MQLTLNNVHTHLISKGLIQRQDVVLGNYNVTQSSTRNNIIKVSTDKKKYFIKQLTEQSEAALYRIQKDATCLFLIYNLDAYNALREYVAEYYGYYTDHNFLITELFEDTISLDRYFREQIHLSENIYNQLIDVLKSIHVPILDEIKTSKSLQFFAQAYPWILDIEQTSLVDYRAVHTGQEMVIQNLLRNPVTQNCLELARFHWKSSTLIHGDIKFLNFIIDPEERISVVDWEYADIGDPLWDLAGLIQNIICNKILEYEGLLDSGETIYNIPMELNTIWKRVAQIWERYETNEDLDKTIIFTSARLLQTAVEYNIRTLHLKPSVEKIMNTAIFLFNNRSTVHRSIVMHLN